MSFHFDTSAVVKWLVDEVGSADSVGTLETADASWTCRVTYPETRAVVAALRRGGPVLSMERPGAWRPRVPSGTVHP